MRHGVLSALRGRIEGPQRHQSGLALVMVLAVTLLVTLVVTAGVTFAVNQRVQVRDNQDWQAAVAAAQAGIDDYTSKLNNDGIYWKYGHTSDYCTSCTFLSGSTTPSSTNTAFNGWTAIPGVTGRGQFRYEVDNSLYPTRGIVKLRASGKVNDEIRTIDVQVRRGGFIDFLYFTDYELLDPSISSSPTCSPRYWYDNTSRCGTDIQFIPGDAINGPAHSNDAILMCTGSRTGTPSYGPVFNDRLSTGYNGSISSTSGLKYRRTCTTSAPFFAVSGDPRGPVVLAMPPSNTDYSRETDPAQVVAPDVPGCRYTGPTRIVLNSNGTMTVTSPATKSPHPVSGCASGSTTGVTVNIPTSGIVYVQNVPAASDAFTKWPNPTSPQCTTNNSYPAGSRVTNNGVGYPLNGTASSGSSTREDQSQEPSGGYRYSCTNGDVFLSGVLNGRLTIAAENTVVVTNDVTYSGGPERRRPAGDHPQPECADLPPDQFLG